MGWCRDSIYWSTYKRRRVKEEIGDMKYLLWVSLIIAVIVAVYELTWLGRSSLAWVIIVLAVAIGLQAVYLIRKK